MISTKLLELKSEELNIAFTNLLAGATAELAVSAIAHSNMRNNMWLCNGDDIGIDTYKLKPVTAIRYVYGGNKSMSDLISEVEDCLKHVFIENNYKFLAVKKDDRTNSIDFSHIYIELELEEKYVPLEIGLKLTKDASVLPYTRTYKLLCENNENVEYLHFPAEEALCHHICEIMKKMELINDMYHYYEAYKILNMHSLEGRKMRDILYEKCGEAHIKKEAKTYATLYGYRDYKYMEKKWKTFLKKEKRMEPTWQETVDKINDFLEPIWEAVVEDRIFFGDWMPEIGRYLD
ncbi:MAG: hypothetical protein IJ655_10630 [Lachnospiraceae bacterium]|nr:hypothetical protein [Lachnospiraceae bacterium]MBR1573188.1 hypothetical protein [Lachnospiraceae bacterium]